MAQTFEPEGQGAVDSNITAGTDSNEEAPTTRTDTTNISYTSSGGDSDVIEVTWASPSLCNADWPLGDYKGGIEVLSIGADQSFKIQLHRYQSGDVDDETLGTSCSFNTTGPHSFTANVNPVAGATGDRFVMFLLGSRGANHGQQALDTLVNDPDTFMEVPFGGGGTIVKVAPTFTVGITESRNKLKTMVRNATTFTVAINEARNHLKTMVRNAPTFTVGLTEARNKVIGIVKNTPTFTVGITEARNKVNGFVKNVPTFTVGITEVRNKVKTMVRNAPTFTVGLTEARNKVKTMVRNTTTATIGLIEARNRLMTMVRNVSTATIGIVEARNRLRSYTRVVATSIVGLIETVNRLLSVPPAAIKDTGGGLMYGMRHKRRKRELKDQLVLPLRLVYLLTEHKSSKPLLKKRIKDQNINKPILLHTIDKSSLKSLSLKGKIVKIIHRSIPLRSILKEIKFTKIPTLIKQISKSERSNLPIIGKRINIEKITKTNIVYHDYLKLLDKLDEIDDE